MYWLAAIKVQLGPQLYTRLAQGLHKSCTRLAQGLHKACTRLAQGLYKACTRFAKGLHQGSKKGFPDQGTGGPQRLEAKT